MSNTTELTAAEKLISLENLTRYHEHIKEELSNTPRLIVGTEAASLDNCPEGCWYGQYS